MSWQNTLLLRSDKKVLFSHLFHEYELTYMHSWSQAWWRWLLPSVVLVLQAVETVLGSHLINVPVTNTRPTASSLFKNKIETGGGWRHRWPDKSLLACFLYILLHRLMSGHRQGINAVHWGHDIWVEVSGTMDAWDGHILWPLDRKLPWTGHNRVVFILSVQFLDFLWKWRHWVGWVISGMIGDSSTILVFCFQNKKQGDCAVGARGGQGQWDIWVNLW